MPHLKIVLIPFISLLNLSDNKVSSFEKNGALSFAFSSHVVFCNLGTTVPDCLWMSHVTRKINELHVHKPQGEKTYLRTYSPNEDSNQPSHPLSLIRIFAVHMKKKCIIGYPRCAQ